VKNVANVASPIEYSDRLESDMCARNNWKYMATFDLTVNCEKQHM